MKAIGLIIINFMMAMLLGRLIVSMIDKQITAKGFRLSNMSKYIIFSTLVIISGILCGQMIVYSY
jgi:hypothetical protein